jgi:hypothetical protein
MAKLHAGRNAENQETACARTILGNSEEPIFLLMVESSDGSDRRCGRNAPTGAGLTERHPDISSQRFRAETVPDVDGFRS